MMPFAPYFDWNITEITGKTNNDPSIVLNKYFSEEKDLLEYMMVTQSEAQLKLKYAKQADEEDIKTFSAGPFRSLLEKCEEHRNKHKKDKAARNTLFLVHPLYVFTQEYDYLTSEARKESAEVYFDTLREILCDCNANKVLVETPNLYAATTSLLLEQGLVDDVIFTELDSGYVINKEEFQKYYDANIFLSGMYNKRCLSHFANEIVYHLHNEELYAIKNLVLDSPAEEGIHDLISERIVVRNGAVLRKERNIHLDEFLEKYKN